jgi:ParB family chromosome partitioning protein
VEEYLSDTFATAITIDINKRIKQVQGVLEQGEIRIQFSSLDALNGLIERLAPDMPR